MFSADDTVTGRSVAVKLLHPHLSGSEALRRAFLDEARRTASISHPGIVSIVDVGTFDDEGVPIAWIAQELVPGRTLADHVRAEGALPVADAVAVADSVLAALEAVHSTGWVHRDVSPANVLVHVDDAGMRATLLDFGLADAAGETTRGDDVLRSSAPGADAGVVGNAHFASPEQLRGEPVDRRGDLYQAGGLLFFALTGRRPFEGADRAAVVRAHLHAPPPVPSVCARRIPPELDRVVVRAMLKAPGDRYADAAEMRREIAAAAPSRVPAGGATRVLAPQVPTTAPPDPLPAVDRAPARPVRGREGSGWGAAAAILVVLAAAAAAIPLIAGVGRPSPQPVASVVTAPASAAPTATAAPASTASASAALVAVPPLGTLEEVRAGLARAGLLLDPVTEREGPQAAGTVIEMQPAPGSSVPRGSAVRVVVASGMNRVPPIDGLDATAAAEAVRASGFVPVTEVVASDRSSGSVVALDPGGDTPLMLGSTVRLLLSAGPRQALPIPTAPSVTPATPTATPTPSVAATPLR